MPLATLIEIGERDVFIGFFFKNWRIHKIRKTYQWCTRFWYQVTFPVWKSWCSRRKLLWPRPHCRGLPWSRWPAPSCRWSPGGAAVLIGWGFDSLAASVSHGHAWNVLPLIEPWLSPSPASDYCWKSPFHWSCTGRCISSGTPPHQTFLILSWFFP